MYIIICIYLIIIILELLILIFNNLWGKKNKNKKKVIGEPGIHRLSLKFKSFGTN